MEKNLHLTKPTARYNRRVYHLISIALISSLLLLFLPVNAAPVFHFSMPVFSRGLSHGEANLLVPEPEIAQPVNLSLPFGVLPVQASGGLTITKIVDSMSTGHGGLLNYTIVVSNNTGVTLTNILVTDTVPASTSCQAIEAPSPWGTSLLDCQAGIAGWLLPGIPLPQFELIDGDSASLTYTVQVDQPLPDGFQIVNGAGTYGVTAEQVGAGTPVSDTGQITATTSISAPTWQLSKSSNPTATVEAGDLIEYTITVTNVGNLATSGSFIITDVLPLNSTFSSSPYASQVGGGILTLTVNSVVASGGSLGVNWFAGVTKPLTSGTIITNTPYGVSGGNVFSDAFSTLPITVAVTSSPVLTISKVVNPGQETPNPGDIITYTIIYENVGTNVATNVAITDTIPANTTFGGSIPAPNANDPDYGWFTSTLALNDPQIITLWVQLNNGLSNGLLLTNTVTITGQEGSTEVATESVTVSSSPILNALKSDDVDPVLAGGPLVYTILVTNTGNTTATGVVLTDTLDAFTAFITATLTPAPGSCPTCRFNLNPLGPGMTDMLTITTTVHSTATHLSTLVNNVNVSTAETTTLTIQETTTVSATDFAISKSLTLPDPPNNIQAGQFITYTIHYTNSSPVPATNIRITDTMPLSVTTPLTITAPGAALANGTLPGLVFTRSTLINDTGAITIIARVLTSPWPVTLLDLTNQVTATIDQNPTRYTDTVTTSAGPDDPAQAAYSATPLEAVINTPITITAVLTDQYGNPVLNGQVISFTTSPALGTINDTTTSNGQVASALNSTSPGTTTVQVGNPGVAGAGVVITFTAATLEIEKIVNRTLAQPTNLLVYSMTITNSGTTTATNVVVTDTLPNDVSFVSTDAVTYTAIPPVYVLSLNDIPATLTATVQLTVSVNPDAPDNALLVNEAMAASLESTTTPTGSVTTTVAAPAFAITKAAFPPVAVAGEAITYTITFTSDGSLPVAGLRITDTLPLSLTGLSLISDTPGLAREASVLPEIAFSAPSFTGSGVITITSLLTTTPWPSTPLPVTNLVTGTIDINPTLFVDQATVSGSSGPPFTITLTATPPITEAGRTIAIAATIIDQYGNPITDGQLVLFNSTLAGSSFTTLNPVPSSNGLANVSLTSVGGGESTISAQVGGISRTTVVTFTAPALTVGKTGDRDQVSPGGTVVYTIILTNTGDSPLTNILLTDSFLQSQLHYVASSPPRDSFSGQMSFFNLLPLNAGLTQTVILTATVDPTAPAGLFLENTASVTTTELPASTPDTEDSATVEIVRAGLDLSKSAGKAVVLAGETLTYTIAYTNNNLAPIPMTLTNILLTDLLPPEIMSVTIDPGGAVVADNTPPTLAFTRAVLAPAAIDAITIVAQVITSPWGAAGLNLTNALTATADLDALGQTAQATSQGRPNVAATLVITASPISTTVANNVVVTATVTDQYGNPVYDGTAVDFASSLAGTTIVSSTTTGGLAATTLSSTAVGTTTVTASAGAASDNLQVIFSEVVSRLVYLPVILKNHPTRDLVVDLIEVSAANPAVGEPVVISVTIRNAGTGPASRFWVDLYLTTAPVTPQVNDLWNDLGSLGVAWIVPGLGAGQSLTITNLDPNDLGDPANCDHVSNFTPPLVGLCDWTEFGNSNSFSTAETYYVTALVDSFDEDAVLGDGNIVETDETNNVYSGSVTITVSGGARSEPDRPDRPVYEPVEPGARRSPLRLRETVP